MVANFAHGEKKILVSGIVQHERDIDNNFISDL